MCRSLSGKKSRLLSLIAVECLEESPLALGRTAVMQLKTKGLSCLCLIFHGPRPDSTRDSIPMLQLLALKP